MDTNIFREYDIRGIVGTQLTVPVVETLAAAFGAYFRRNGASRIAIGQDARESSPVFAEILIRCLNESRIDVVSIGMVPTPVLYHALFTYDVDGGVMITGSHNPNDHNGFKISLGTDSLFGDQIREIGEITKSQTPLLSTEGWPKAGVVAAAGDALSEPPASAGGQFAPSFASSGQKGWPPANAGGSDTGSAVDKSRGESHSLAVLEAYIADIVYRITLGNRKLKIVVDSGNGVGGLTAVPIYRELGVDLIELYTEPDATFPNHHADPTVEENLHDLIAAVREHKADIGLAFDGDGDRIGVVDETGRIIWGDELMIPISRSVLAENPGATVIAEVKCSQTLFDDIAANGGTPLMWKAGHSIIKAKMKETGALLAGEMSGHIFFADRYHGFDDATYVGARLLEMLSRTDKPFSSFFADIPKTYSTPELRIPCPDDIKFEVVAKIAEHFARNNKVITTDGARIQFENGWGLVRPSNTQAILVLRFEAKSQEALEDIKAVVELNVKELIGARGL